jgi:hypothetical protein
VKTVLKRLLVAVTLVAFASGAMTLVGCSKKEETTTTTTTTTDSMGMAPADTGMMMDTTMAPPDTTMR